MFVKEVLRLPLFSGSIRLNFDVQRKRSCAWASGVTADLLLLLLLLILLTLRVGSSGL